MLRANIEYESGFFGGIKRIIVQGPNGTKTFYGEESRDEAEAYYRNEKRLEEEMLLRQKQSDLADLQMREIKERERRTREEELRQKNTPIRPYINEIPQPRQRPRSIIPELNLPNKPLNIPVNSSSQYDPEYIEFQKWKRERDPEYIKFKEEKAKETAETERQRQEIEAQKKREQEKKAITEAKKLLNTAKLQTLNKNLPTALNKITEIESLIQKNTLDDSLKAINLLTNQYSWSIGSGKTVLANLTEFDSQYSKAQADLRAEEKIRREAERKRKEAEQIAAQKRDEAARIAAQRKKEAEDSVRQAKQARAAKRFWRTIFWIAVIAVGIALILNYTDNNNSSNIMN